MAEHHMKGDVGGDADSQWFPVVRKFGTSRSVTKKKGKISSPANGKRDCGWGMPEAVTKSSSGLGMAPSERMQ